MNNSALQHIRKLLLGQDYLIEDGIAMSVFLALNSAKPLLVEGSAGVGKTEIAKAIAKVWNSELIRLQCGQKISARRRKTSFPMGFCQSIKDGFFSPAFFCTNSLRI